MITEKQLRDSVPGITTLNVNKYLPELNKTLPKYGITTPIRIAHYLAQIGHENNSFNSYRENLNYSEEGLLKTFKSDFDVNHDHVISESEKLKADQIAHNPKQIADFVYANQNGNGNELTGDGSKYMGRGPIMVTGESNYEACSMFLFGDKRLLDHPELLELPEYSILASCWFWTIHKLNNWADADNKNNPAAAEAVVGITKIINGGTNGLDDRKARLLKAKRAFNI